MEHANPIFLLIIYKILKGRENKENFEQIENFNQLFENKQISNITTAQILLNIINHYNLEVKLVFDESPFFDEEGIRRGIEWSRLDDLIENTILLSLDNMPGFYDEEGEILSYKDFFKENIKIARESINLDWLSFFVKKTNSTNNNDAIFLCESILSCVKFYLYQKNNIKKIEQRFLKYLEYFKKDKLKLTKLANFYNYKNNKEILINSLSSNYTNFGNSCFIKENVLPQEKNKFRFIDTLFTFEYIEDYISINKIEFKKDESHCLLTIKKKLINKLDKKNASNNDSKENKLSKFKIKFDKSKSLIKIGEKTCIIPQNTKEKDFCSYMFTQPKNEWISWDVIAENINEENEELDRKAKRSIQDKLYSINKKVKKTIKTDDNLFDWGGRSVKRNY